VWLGEQPVYLSATEYRLLLQFTHNIGKVLAAEELLDKCVGPEYRDDKEILWVTIARLRQKVESDPTNPGTLSPVPGWVTLCLPSKADLRQEL